MKSDEFYIEHTRNWVEKVVIGLGLCPFAGVPFRQNRIRFVVSHEVGEEGVLREAKRELDELINQPPEELETTLLILPEAFPDFLDYYDFLEKAEILIEAAGYEGILQVASFHPGYLFAEFPPSDTSHFTNRSPYPMLHFLREESVSYAIDSHPNIHGIPEDNIDLMHSMGHAQIKALWKACQPPTA